MVATRTTFAGLALLLGVAGCTEVPRKYSTRAADGEVIFKDDFNRDGLGPSWQPTGDGAVIEDGVLVTRGLRNHPLWLDLPLPNDVRIEFDAWAGSEEGDLKVELFGDGTSYATSDNYTASGYVAIFGGWNNTMNALVRKNEHGRDRETASEPKVEPDRRYHVVLIRSADELHWELDGTEVLSYQDPQPLRGPGNDRFAFSGWEAEAHFDNLVIEALK